MVLLCSHFPVSNLEKLLMQMECILRHCLVMNPKAYARANNEGDDVFLCEYEYDIHWHSFKRLAEIDDIDEVAFLIQLEEFFASSTQSEEEFAFF